MNCFVEFQQDFGRRRNDEVFGTKFDAVSSTTPFDAFLATRIVNQDTSHGFGGGTEKNRTIGPR